MPIYISSLISKKGTSRDSLVSFSPKKISFFSYKKTYFLRAITLVFKRFGDPFAAHDRNQQVGRGAQSNFLTSAVGRFLSKDNVYAL